MKREQLRERLVEATHRVLLENEPGTVSVRAITDAAGVNVASVNTAFGGRTALLDEVFARVLEPINEERERRYQSDRSSRDVVSIMRAFITPLVSTDWNASSVLRGLVREVLAATNHTARPLDRILTDPGIGRLTLELLPLLPELSESEVAARVQLAVGAIFAATALHTSEPQLEELIMFTAAGIAHQPLQA